MYNNYQYLAYTFGAVIRIRTDVLWNTEKLTCTDILIRPVPPLLLSSVKVVWYCMAFNKAAIPISPIWFPVTENKNHT